MAQQLARLVTMRRLTGQRRQELSRVTGLRLVLRENSGRDRTAMEKPVKICPSVRTCTYVCRQVTIPDALNGFS